MEQRAKKPFSVWAVLAGLVLIYAGMSGILYNTLGVFFSAIITDMGFKAGEISFYYTIKAIVGALVLGTTTKLFLEKNGRMVMLVLEIIFIGTFAAMAFLHNIWAWYIDGLISGIGGTCFIVAIPIVINNWFVKKRGLALGITLSSYGIAGALLSPVFSGWITAMGWRNAILLTAALSAVMILLPTIFLFKVTPAEVGMKPYGYEEGSEETKETEEVHRNIPLSTFLLIMFAIVLPCMLVSFVTQMPFFTSSLGYALSVGALLTSNANIGNVAGKVIVGFLSDRIGIYKTTLIFLCMVVVSLVLFITMQGSPAVMYVAALLFGMDYAIYMNSQSMVLLDIYGPTDYRMKLSRLQSILSLTGACMAFIIPSVYDVTGSFNPFFYFGILACAVSFILFLRLMRISRQIKLHEEAVAGGLAE